MSDQVFKTKLTPIIITNQMWKQTTNDLVNDIIQLAVFYNDPKNQDAKYTTKLGDLEASTESPTLILIPMGLVEWVLVEPRTPWELQVKIMSLIGGDASDPTAVFLMPELD